MAYFKRVVSKPLGEILVERGLISGEQLEEALKAQQAVGGLLGEVLVSMEAVSEENIAQALTTQFGFPYLPLDTYDIEPDVLSIIPREAAVNFSLVPLDKIGNIITIAMADPLNEKAIKEVESLTGCKVHPFVSTISDVKNAIERYYSARSG